MQGLPGSGKTTVANQLAGKKGKILSLDKAIVSKLKKFAICEESSLYEIYDEIFKEFSEETEKGTEVIVVDNTNLFDWEYIRFARKA